MNLETKITIYKFTPQLFTLTLEKSKTDRVQLQIRYIKLGFCFCNDFHYKSLICTEFVHVCIAYNNIINFTFVAEELIHSPKV